MKPKIILNCFPPVLTTQPSPALSILKSFMLVRGYHVDIKYWNHFLLDFQIRYLGNIVYTKDTNTALLPFINYIWVQSRKRLDNSNIKNMLLSMNPLWYNLGFDYVENRMREYASEFEQIITSEILKMNLDKCQIFGITTKFYQWICGGIIAQKVKELFPEIKIVAGGFGTSDEALAMMSNFEYYDFAIWGEGEYPLLHFCDALETSSNTETPNLIYRNRDGIPHISQSIKKDYFDLSSDIHPDFSDFFTQNTNSFGINLTFEGSRGCHWKRCKFCYLNDGYRYRIKSNENKIKEFKYHIEKYNIRQFIYIGNDVIGKDTGKFEEFLDGLIKLKEEYNDFAIYSLEIITKNINSTIVRKMALAGIQHAVTGYESASNRLLQKINKKNTFASNLLFIKWAIDFSLSFGGINVIQGLMEETADDIFEATDNLFYLRFFLSRKAFKHRMISLRINKSSPYFQDIESNNKLAEWNKCFLSELFPDNYINQSDKYYFFEYKNVNSAAKQWDFFKKVEGHFLNSKYDYQIFKKDNIFHYCEFLDDVLINELAFEEPLHWEVLKSCNHHVISLQDICASVPLLNSNNIVSAVEFLKNEGLIYHNDDFSEIVTPINTDNVLKTTKIISS